MILRYSAIDSFVQCPSKWYRNYVIGQREEVKSSALEFGTAMHLALKTHFEGGDPYAIFEMYWNSITSLHLEYDRFSHSDLRSMAIDTFLPNFIRLHSKKFKNVTQEEQLEMPFMGEHTLQGTYDLAGDYEDVLTITDYKTSAREYNISKLYRNPQLYIYAALYKHKYNVLPKQVMYKVFIKTDRRIQTLKVELTEESLSTMMGNVELIVKNMVRMVEEKAIYCNYNGCFCGTPKECFPGVK